MIHHEPWFQKHAMEEDLRQLQELARRGDPDALVKLRRLQERTNQPLEGEGEAQTVEDVTKLIQQSEQSHGTYIPFLRMPFDQVQRNLDTEAKELWLDWTKHYKNFGLFSPNPHPDLVRWYMENYPTHHDIFDGDREFAEFWDYLEPRIAGNVALLTWLLQNRHPYDEYPDPTYFTEELLAQVPKEAQPTIDFDTTIYSTAEGGAFWDSDRIGSETIPVAQFMEENSNYTWEVDSENPRVWSLKGSEVENPELYQDPETDQFTPGIEQMVLTFPNETPTTIRWVAKIMDPRNRLISWP